MLTCKHTSSGFLPCFPKNSPYKPTDDLPALPQATLWFLFIALTCTIATSVSCPYVVLHS